MGANRLQGVTSVKICVHPWLKIQQAKQSWIRTDQHRLKRFQDSMKQLAYSPP